MFKFLFIMFSLRVLFKAMLVIVGIFMVYAIYLFIQSGADIHALKDYIITGFNDAIKWIEKVFTFHLDRDTVPDPDGDIDIETMSQLKDSLEFLAYYIKHSLC